MSPVERVVRGVDALQQRHKVTAVAYGVVRKLGDDNAGMLAGSLALAAFTAVFPLLLFLVTLLGLVLGNDPGARNAILHSTFGQFPLIGDQLSHNVHALKRGSAFGITVGLVGLLWGSMGLAQAGLFTMEQVWDIPGPERPGFARRIARSLAFLGTLGLALVITTFLAGFGTFGHHNVLLGLIGELLAVAVNIGLYLAAFRVLTPKAVPWRSLVAGAVAGGLGWTVLQAVGGYVVGHYLRNDNAVYGIFGVVLGLLAWIYLGVRLSVYAAELNVVLARRLWPRSMVRPPPGAGPVSAGSRGGTGVAVMDGTTSERAVVESDLPQIRELRRRRGQEKVTFDQVAHHLVDLAAAQPAQRDAVDRVAGFLARAETAVDDRHISGGGMPGGDMPDGDRSSGALPQEPAG